MRRGLVFRRCTKCGARLNDRRCARCGGERFTWAYAVDIAPKGTPRIQKTKAGFATKAAAVEAIANLQTEKRDGTYIEPSKQTVAMYLEAWLAGTKGSSSIRTSTWKSYEVIMRTHVVPELGRVLLQQLTRDQVRAMYASVASPEGRKKPRSQKTVHNVHLALRKAFADAVDAGLLRANPAERAHKLSTDRPEMLTWSAAEVRLFLERSEGSDNRALWRLALQTGMRRGELLGLRWQDVDLEASRLSVRQQLVRADDQVVLGPPKTKAGRRSISLDAGTVVTLRAHKLRQSPLSASKHGLVFARGDGRPHDPDVISQQFAAATRRAGVKRIRLHDCRHTHASLLLEAGIHPKVVQERLGHSSVMVTLDRYSHVAPNMQADAATRIGMLVDGVL